MVSVLLFSEILCLLLAFRKHKFERRVEIPEILHTIVDNPIFIRHRTIFLKIFHFIRIMSSNVNAPLNFG